YLRRHPLPEALARFCGGLKRYAAALGKAQLYNETITVAYLTLFNERMARLGREADWEDFAAANTDSSATLPRFDPTTATRPCTPTCPGLCSSCRIAWPRRDSGPSGCAFTRSPDRDKALAGGEDVDAVVAHGAVLLIAQQPFELEAMR